MRAHRMSPKMPASVTPMASTARLQPSGMASMAVLVEIGDDQDSGVARSSRAGTKRSVKAGPTSRFCPGRNGFAPRSQTFRKPFLRRTVVMVAVVTCESVAMASGGRDIEKFNSGKMSGAHLARHGHRVKGRAALLLPATRDMLARSSHLIGGGWISLLKSLAFFTLEGRADAPPVIDCAKFRRGPRYARVTRRATSCQTGLSGY